jgi:hypothetical protein
MQRRAFGSLVFAFFLLWTMPVKALTASELLASCETLERTWDIQPNGEIRFRVNDGLSCWSYIQAFFDLAYARLRDSDRPNDPFKSPLDTCPPKGISQSQLVRMFLQHARAHTADLHNSAWTMMYSILRQNYPCP